MDSTNQIVKSGTSLIEPIDFPQFGNNLRDTNLYSKETMKTPLSESLINPCKCNFDCQTIA